MKRHFLAAILALVLSGAANAADASHALRIRGGDVRLSADTRIVMLEGRSIVHLPPASEKNHPILVVVLDPAAVGSRVVADGQTIQGLQFIELGAPGASVLFHPVNGMGYVR